MLSVYKLRCATHLVTQRITLPVFASSTNNISNIFYISYIIKKKPLILQKLGAGIKWATDYEIHY